MLLKKHFKYGIDVLKVKKAENDIPMNDDSIKITSKYLPMLNAFNIYLRFNVVIKIPLIVVQSTFRNHNSFIAYQ